VDKIKKNLREINSDYGSLLLSVIQWCALILWTSDFIMKMFVTRRQWSKFKH